jgi:hypothetical protein
LPCDVPELFVELPCCLGADDVVVDDDVVVLDEDVVLDSWPWGPRSPAGAAGWCF